MENKQVFDDYVLQYDKYRSTYVKELFDDLFSYSNCNKDSFVVEVGCGTGQATSWVLKTGCALKAIEIGKNLCEFTKEKFKDHNNLEVINMPFEDYEVKENSVDLIYSASAFHWIPEDIGYPKVYKALKQGGSFAIFGCPVEISDENKKLKDEIEELEMEYFPAKNTLTHEDENLTIQQQYEKYGFRDYFYKQYSTFRGLEANEYIGLLLSVSAYGKLDNNIRDALFEKMRGKINKYGRVQVHDKIDLHICRK
ncbi:MAG: class I SAM-dependent methyltransferase [Defluviitaleaceae bacterium]|nr:class I SAM-dependent methyltransferase [Defluviitaleaceae bacterium]